MMDDPQVVSYDEWLVARKALLVKERRSPKLVTTSTPHADNCRWSRSTRTTTST